jgi:hypothetical protein
VWVAPLLSHPDSLGIFYTARAQVFKTINYGASWFAISSGTTGSLEQMTISKTNPMIMYASRSNILYQSTDGGYTFKQRNIGISRTISSVNIHPDSSNVVIVTFSGFGAGKIYKTTNGAASWVGISGDLPDVPVNDGMIYYPGTSTSVYLVATDVGVFMSNNWGNKWVEVASGLPNTVSMHLDYHSTTNKLRIGTHGRGVYEISGLVGVINQSSSVSEGYSLGQNFPNPFNPATLIKYSIKDAGNVKLRVYDLLGREIQTLVNEYQKPGEYTAQFSANSLNLSSGVYIYKLETDGFTDSKKMLMIK